MVSLSANREETEATLPHRVCVPGERAGCGRDQDILSYTHLVGLAAPGKRYRVLAQRKAE